MNNRLVSLDVFRGLTMAAMVIVNNPGDWGNVYGPLLHAPWHGWTPTDLIFPFFLFIVGVSITLSRQVHELADDPAPQRHHLRARAYFSPAIHASTSTGGGSPACCSGSRCATCAAASLYRVSAAATARARR